MHTQTHTHTHTHTHSDERERERARADYRTQRQPLSYVSDPAAVSVCKGVEKGNLISANIEKSRRNTHTHTDISKRQPISHFPFSPFFSAYCTFKQQFCHKIKFPSVPSSRPKCSRSARTWSGPAVWFDKLQG